MKKQIFTTLGLIILFSSPDANALFGRRGPVGRVLFGPGPQILGSRIGVNQPCMGRGCGMRNSCGPRGCGNGQGSCGPRGCGNGQGSCGPGGCGNGQGSCGPGGCGNGQGNCGPGGCGNGQGSCGPGGCGQVDPNGSNATDLLNSGINSGLLPNGSVDPNGVIDPSTGAQSLPGLSPAAGTAVDPSQQGGSTLTNLNGTFQENGSPIFISESPQCLFFTQDSTGQRRGLEQANGLKIIQSYVDRRKNGIRLNAHQNCALSAYGKIFLPQTQGSNPTTPQAPTGNHGGGGGTGPQRPQNPNPQSVFSKWKGDFNSEGAISATDESILASAYPTPSEGKNFNYNLIEQDCVSKTDPDQKIPTTTILFSTPGEDGKLQSHIGFVSGRIKPEDKARVIGEAYERSLAGETGGDLKRITADDSAMYTTLKIGSIEKDYPETQVQLKKMIKNGQEQFVIRYVHKHKSSIPDSKWKLTDSDEPFYCENSAQGVPQTGKLPVPGDTALDRAKESVEKAQQEQKPEEKKQEQKAAIDVTNLLKSKCLSCHKASNENGLVIDSNGKILTPGMESEIINRITSSDSDVRMPKNKQALSREEILAIKSFLGAK